ncbi:MAG: hypothetical protein CFE26_04750 [Verrucomicrobiales bacterium VVV1]|nr:MAG: hypothetical protein CFE26_04750 [Verrucomicrobiales bacterium VVV1]
MDIKTTETHPPTAPKELIAVPIIIVHQAPFRSLRIAITPIHWAIRATITGNTNNELVMTHETQRHGSGQSASMSTGEAGRLYRPTLSR